MIENENKMSSEIITSDTTSATIPTTTFGSYGKSFQEKIMQALLTDRAWAEQMMEVFNSSYFELKYLQFLADRYFAYSKKYKVFPTLQLLAIIVREDLKVGTDVILRDQIIDYLQRIKNNPDPGDLQFVREKSLDFCRKQALKVALEVAVDQMQAEKYESIVDCIRKAVLVGTTPAIGHDFFNDYEARFTRLQRNCVSTGIHELDRKEIFNGGLGAGEIGVIVAATGVGKCVNRTSFINIKYVGIKINGQIYKPWEKIATKRGNVFIRDITESDELI